MAKPYYFQTEDEKRMAAIRANPSGRPMQMVRPMRPASSDSREKWRENAGGKMIGMDQYLENNRKMYTLENVPNAAPKEQLSNKDILRKYGGTQAIQAGDNRPSGVYNERGERVESDNRSPGVYENGKRISPYRPPTAPIAPTSNWQQDITKRFPDIGKKGTPMNTMFVSRMEPSAGESTLDAMRIAEDVAKTYGPNTPGAARVGDYSAPTAPTSQDIAEMEKAGTADMSPRFSPIEMRKSTLNAWQSGALAPLIDKTEPYGTALNDRPGRGRSFENLSRPMGMGMLPQRPTSTASGASERVAERRAIRMNPKSSEADRRWAKGIGGARNTSYGNYD